MYYVYMIRVEGGALYTGIAKNLFSRMAQHAGRGKKCAKFTRGRPVLSIDGLWTCADRSAASRLEYAIKRLSKKEKEALLLSPRLFAAYFPSLEKEDFVFHPWANLSLYLKEITLPCLPFGKG